MMNPKFRALSGKVAGELKAAGNTPLLRMALHRSATEDMGPGIGQEQTQVGVHFFMGGPSTLIEPTM
jgi:hypothetical protein